MGMQFDACKYNKLNFAPGLLFKTLGQYMQSRTLDFWQSFCAS